MITTGSKKDIRQMITAASILVISCSVLAAVGSVLVISQNHQKNLEVSNNLEAIKTKELLSLKADEQISNAKSDSTIAAKTNTLIIRGVTKSNLFKESKVNLDSMKSFNDGLLLNITDENRTIIGTFDGSQVCQFQSKVCINLE